MKFGKVDDPSKVDFKLPKTPVETFNLLNKYPIAKDFKAYVGCAKWNKTDLKGFYPKGTKDELSYYANQFNSIELNATFYNSPSLEQVQKWKNKTSTEFKFFPKIPKSISHFSRLMNTEQKVLTFLDAITAFENNLGMIFLQLHENFSPKNLDRLKQFLSHFPKAYSLGVEVRHPDWFTDIHIFKDYCNLLENQHITNIIVDTAGRRDMIHLRLTTPIAFIRYVSANDNSDEKRLDQWLDIIEDWKLNGLQELYFFIHQNTEIESPLIATSFIKKLNNRLGLDLPYPNKNKPELF